MHNDIVAATAAKFHVAHRRLFVDAVREAGFQDVSGQAGYRFQQWVAHGEITPVVENYCLDLWSQSLKEVEHAVQSH